MRLEKPAGKGNGRVCVLCPGSQGKGHLGKNSRRGGTESDVGFRKFAGGYWGWTRKTGGHKTMSEATETSLALRYGDPGPGIFWWRWDSQ